MTAKSRSVSPALAATDGVQAMPGWLEIQVTVLPALPAAGVECDAHPEFPKPLLTRSSEPRALSPVRAVTLGQKHTVAADSCAADLTAEFPTLLLYAREGNAFGAQKIESRTNDR